ncbi:HalOD1 output domain-containing protein [Halorussus sp. AFM4]|uniref:HalOD1 output domain-containing protein n=1 Tax=Halorussus sp. AFM4 TaxID=3421651 RepID=UPI003EB9DA26
MSDKQSTVRPEPVLTYELNGGERPSEGVVAAVAAAAGADPTDLDPLAETLDPDALDALFAAHLDGTPRDAGRTEFSFCGYGVVVNGTGHVSVLDAGR